MTICCPRKVILNILSQEIHRHSRDTVYHAMCSVLRYVLSLNCILFVPLYCHATHTVLRETNKICATLGMCSILCYNLYCMWPILNPSLGARFQKEWTQYLGTILIPCYSSDKSVLCPFYIPTVLNLAWETVSRYIKVEYFQA